MYRYGELLGIKNIKKEPVQFEQALFNLTGLT
jgi:hypothetical protein